MSNAIRFSISRLCGGETGALDVAVGSTNAEKSRGGMRLPRRFTALFDAVPLSHTAIPRLRSPPIWRLTVVTTSGLHCFHMICSGKYSPSRARETDVTDTAIARTAPGKTQFGKMPRSRTKISSRAKKVKGNHELREKLTMNVTPVSSDFEHDSLLQLAVDQCDISAKSRFRFKIDEHIYRGCARALQLLSQI